MRALESRPVEANKPSPHKGFVAIYNYAFLGAYVQELGNIAPKDTVDLLYIGNSFTYYTSSPCMLKEIAWNEGHFINIKGRLSYISDAFFIAQKERSDFNILAADGSHPSKYGAYLKSCVNYLTIYGEPFGSSPADCDIEPEIAAYLRTVAERVVLKNTTKLIFNKLPPQG